MQERGFSLIELLVVVAIIMVISAIAVPSLLHSRIAANEASAVYSVRTINTAQVTYATTYPTAGYATSLNELAAPASGPTSATNAGVLDWVLGCTSAICPKSGYDFTITLTSGSPTVSAYTVWAYPITPGTTGYRGFCSNNMNPVMVDPTGLSLANCTTPLQ
jgi:prepilin-type N-terminal cleavage/methylation domain-containing protein